MYKSCIITHRQGFWAYDTLLACPKLDFFGFHDTANLFSSGVNPYQLEPAEDFDIIFIGSHPLRYLVPNGKEKEVIKALEKKCKKLVLIDGWDSFDLSVPPSIVDLFETVLKVNGVYKDKDLYNWKVGCDYPGVNWTNKETKKNHIYTHEQLDKIKLSFPCQVGIVPEVKRRLRKHNPTLGYWTTQSRNIVDQMFKQASVLMKYRFANQLTSFLGDLGHIQRLELLHLLHDNHIDGDYGVFRVLESMAGLEQSLCPEQVKKHKEELEAHKLLKKKKNRIQYLYDFSKFKSIISPVGYGEMCFRDLEIMQMGRCGIKQDISHVDHLAPFVPNENIIFCKPNFSDLVEILHNVDRREIDYKQIGKNAYKAARSWEQNIDQVLETSIITPLFPHA
ncbi:glycosyltransferase family 1 protein [Reichenbachiella sp. MSK19-1]|uniref:glycosyltransferase family 1 protein n=1 Tax=Reichenbachiella sp. MSK19-1 TaxID=1897631 RepID=UPI000E6CC4F3|nr:glycosyltransferase family 1 protein [Reichenbachiella sp. MSK19-1]RJE70862.1 hypothetical protein BGP76_08750 [Reichenbachiella sp. MSK19-1]